MKSIRAGSAIAVLIVLTACVSHLSQVETVVVSTALSRSFMDRISSFQITLPSGVKPEP